MKIKFLCFLLLVGFGWANAQSKYTDYSKLLFKLGMQEDFESANAIFNKIKQYSCAVEQYPTMALIALDFNHRQEAITFLADAMRFGYNVAGLKTRYPREYEKFTTLTIDSISNHIRNAGTIAFDWQTYIKLNDLFAKYDANRTLARVDSNGRTLVIPLREFMYGYMRQNGFPSDCQVGFGMSARARQCILSTSQYLLDFEFEELDEMLLAAMENYQVSIDFYAFVVDNYFYQNEKTSKFGTSLITENPEFTTYLESQIDEINKRRKAIGLPPKEDFKLREMPKKNRR